MSLDLDTEFAVAFLHGFDPTGWHNLVAIDPENGALQGRTFPPGSSRAMSEWIGARNGHTNIYFSVNEPRPKAPHSKLKKTDIATIRAIFTDIDPSTPDPKEKEALVETAMESDADLAIDSGGGVQLFWTLDKKQPADDFEWAEGCNRRLASDFGGDHTWDVNRIMRLPYTRNLPNAKKRAQGRAPTDATVLRSTGVRWAKDAILEAFPPKGRGAADSADNSDETRAVTEDIKTSDYASYADYEDLPADLRRKFNALLARDTDTHELWHGDGAGNEHRFALAAVLKKEGFMASEYAALAHTWHRATTKPHPPGARELARDWTRSPAFVTAAAEFGEVDTDIGTPPSRPVVKVPQKSDLCLPYRWCEPSLLPPREWLLGRHLIRKFVSITIAPGNIGKSSLVIAEALEMATGRNLIGHNLSRPLNVWYWNLEDPYDELQRRIQAACLRFDVTEDSIQGRLFVNSGRDHPLCLARQGSAGAEICQPVADRLVQALIEKSIDILIIDPFVSSHSVSENDNMAIDAVVKEWGRVADRANIAIELVHHTRKAGGNDHETTTESARGGKALTDAARDVRVLNRMTKDEGKKAGVENPRLHFRTYSDKGNMAPPADSSEWFKLEGVPLGNSDDVGVVVAWTWPDAFAEITEDQIRRVQSAIKGQDFRADVRAKEWVGHAVALCLNMDLDNAEHKSSINAMVKEWIRIGVLLVETRTNDKGRDQDFVLPGRAPDDA